MSARKLNPAAVAAKLRASQATASPTTTRTRATPTKAIATVTTATAVPATAVALPQRTPVKPGVIQTTPVKKKVLSLTRSPGRQRLSSNVVESKLALNFHKARLATPKRTVTQENDGRPTAQLLQHVEAKKAMRDQYTKLKKAGYSTPRKLSPHRMHDSLRKKIESKVAQRDAARARVQAKQAALTPKKPAIKKASASPRTPVPATKRNAIVTATPTSTATATTATTATVSPRTPRQEAEKNLMDKYGPQAVAKAYSVYDFVTAEEQLRQEQQLALERVHLEAKTRAATEMRRMRHKHRRMIKARQIPVATGFDGESSTVIGSASPSAIAARSVVTETTSVDRHGSPVPALIGSEMARAMLPPDMVEHFESKVEARNKALFQRVKDEYASRKRAEYEAGQRRSPDKFMDM